MANQVDDMIDGDENAEVADAPVAKGAGNARLLAGLKSNGVLAALFLAAGIGIYIFAIKRGPAQASAQQKQVELQVDSAILRLSQPTSGPSESTDTQQLIKNFYSEIAQRQVPLEKLKKNPFVFVPPTSAPAAVTTRAAEDPPLNPVDVNEKAAYDKAMANLKKMTLQSVVMGKNGGTAIISNNLLTVGQQIEEFTIKSITPKSAVLTFQGKDYTLYMP